MGLRRGAASGGVVVGGCAGAHHGAAYGRGAELRRGAAAWGCAWASVGLHRGAAAWGCAKVLYVAA